VEQAFLRCAARALESRCVDERLDGVWWLRLRPLRRPPSPRVAASGGRTQERPSPLLPTCNHGARQTLCARSRNARCMNEEPASSAQRQPGRARPP
jgi:hypothetical protein